MKGTEPGRRGLDPVVAQAVAFATAWSAVLVGGIVWLAG